MENSEAIGNLLQANGLKRTPVRTEILGLFMSYDFAMSASDLMAKMKDGKDRVTVYRTLSSFEDKGILHKASEDSNGVKYALCSHSCPDQSHAEKHAHFVCNQCQQTYCLDDVEVPEVQVSAGFLVNSINYTLSGICKTCAS